MDQNEIRILLVDDHGLFREGVVRLLNSESDLTVVDHCASVEEALRIVGVSTVDIVLLDVDLGKERGSKFLLRARERGFQGRFLVVTAGVSAQEGSQLLRLGADGIFLKQSRPEQLTSSIRAVMRGETWIDPQFVLPDQEVGESSPSSRRPLTRRERDVLKGVLEGLANKEIAGQLGISESSVKAALQQLFDKSGVRTRGQLVRVALERYLDQL